VLVVHAGSRTDAPGHTGRFPEANVPLVADRLARLLDLLRPSGVVTAAAAGADLLVCEAAIALDVPLHLVLPLPARRFREVSVSDRAAPWGLAYDRVLAHVSSTTGCSLREHGFEPDDESFRLANGLLVDRARALAGDDVLAVVVRPQGGQQPPSVTDDFVARVLAAGWFRIEIDPRQP
jgi:hypothetical protein